MKIRIFFVASCALFIALSLSTRTLETTSAQDVDKSKPANGVRRNFTEVSGWVTKSAEMVPAEKYNYKPVDTVRTFGEQIGHITDSFNYFCAHGAGNKVQWADPVEKGKTDKETLLPKLKEAVDKCNAVHASETAQLVPLITNIGHTNLHYGNVITYMRMMGLKPPSS
jgi:hypothetical protein